MPSLARKSMKFMRDVYNIAANPDGSSVPAMPAHSQGFQPSQGLSGQFTQTYGHQNPPLSAHPAYPANSSYGYPYVGPQQSQPQPQPYGSWNVPPTPVSPLSPQPEHSFPPTTTSSPNNVSAVGLPLSPQACLSPSTPQLYHQQPQFAAPQPPPLPQRPSHHGHSSSWQGSSETGWQSQSQMDPPAMSHSAHEYNQAPQYPIQPFSNIQHPGPGSYHGQTEAQSTRPSPPPLPPRMQAQKPDLVPKQAARVPNSPNWPYPSQESYVSTPNVPSPAQFNLPECHEMAANAIPAQPPIRQHQHADISSLAELPAADHCRITPPPPSLDKHPATMGSTAVDAVELPASPIRRSTHHPTHQRRTSRTHSQGHTPPNVEELDSTPAPASASTSTSAPFALTHRDLGVALPPSTVRSPAYLSLAQSQHSDTDTTMPLSTPPPPPSLQTPPSTSSYPEEPPYNEPPARVRLRPAGSVHEPSRSGSGSGSCAAGRPGRRISAAAATLPYPEENGPVVMPLHFDFTNADRQGAMVEGTK
ncbi:hypothetical protein G647_02777 [Cladophialophora carrionii CBS 160.54]|uniref:Uncharacterized protein n=1 Tax=Cladophialophora carrionii CBS 160.54 TaxID=1279043 RepID=V9DGM6_9EURO|nr:uncharacterized protein G647_02777 [Cladophialophora carrionii CBS 160.54]ETI26000.1 hypothetical protein G647_02777 [Cladophialophora carrionii CBS 160.54]